MRVSRAMSCLNCSSFQDILSLWMGDAQSTSGSETDANATVVENEEEEERKNNAEMEQEALLDKQVRLQLAK